MAMKILSLFDGISCGQVALVKSGIQIDQFFASQIDKNAIKATKANFPKTKHLGDVKLITKQMVGQIDLIMGGSPCQSFSGLNMGKNGLSGKSGLFYEFVRILREVKPKYFLLENVCMKKQWEDIITKQMGVNPVFINSADFSAQHRKRLYWTNIPFDGIGLIQNNQVIQDHVQSGSFPQLQISPQKLKTFQIKDSRSNGIHHLGIVPQRFMPKGNYMPRERVFAIDGKSRCLTTHSNLQPYYMVNGKIRRLTALQFERLQGLPDNYTSMLAFNARIKAVGNGWTVPVISHIFNGLK